MINQLIVNADDFGMTQANTIGILVGHSQGIITSTTCMMNMPYAEFALKEAKKFPQLGVGVHLVLTVGRPLVEGAQSYTDQNGDFIRPKDYPDGKPHANQDELYREWKAQIEKFIEIAGHKPTHIDSHHHVHLLPWHLDVTKRLALDMIYLFANVNKFLIHILIFLFMIRCIMMMPIINILHMFFHPIMDLWNSCVTLLILIKDSMICPAITYHV